jgi:hypothetical protein
MIRRVTLALLLVGAVTTLGFMVYAGDLGSPSSWLFFLGLAAWTLMPYGIVAAETRRYPGSQGSMSLLCATAALLSGVSIVLLYLAFVAQPDAQSALVLVFLPLWQSLGLLPFLAGSRFIARRGTAA